MKKMKKKWTEPERSVGYHKENQYMHNGSPKREERWKNRKNILRNNGRKVKKILRKNEWIYTFKNLNAIKIGKTQKDITIKLSKTKDKEKIMRLAKEKQLIIYNRALIRSSTDLSSEIRDARRHGITYCKW